MATWVIRMKSVMVKAQLSTLKDSYLEINGERVAGVTALTARMSADDPIPHITADIVCTEGKVVIEGETHVTFVGSVFTLEDREYARQILLRPITRLDTPDITWLINTIARLCSCTST